MKNSKKINLNNLNKRIFFIILLVVLIGSVQSAITSESNINFFDTKVVELKESWIVKDSEGTKVKSFPYTVSYKEEEIVEYTKDITEITNEKEDKGCIITNCGDFKIYINNIMVYEFYDSEFYEYKNKMGSKVHIFDLPKEFNKDEIKIETKIYNSKNNKLSIKNVFIGTNSNIINKIAFGQWPIVFISFLTMLFGVILILIWIITNHKEVNISKEFLYVGMFAFFSSIYAFSSLNIFQLIKNDMKLINSLIYMSKLIIPIPVLLIISKNIGYEYKKFIEWCMYLLAGNLFIQTLLNVLEIRDFQSMISYFNIIIFSTVIIIFIAIIEDRRQVSYYKKISVITVFPVIMGMITDIILYQTNLSFHDGIFFLSGVILFIILHTGNIIAKFTEHYKKSIKAIAYRELAYTDIMTSIGNRTYYAKTIKEINENIEKYSNVWSISIDLNLLKFINDTKGHSEGDKLLINFSKILRETFHESGHYFRTGGDEFNIFLIDFKEEEVSNKINSLKEALKLYNESAEVEISIALGYDKFKIHEDKGLLDTIVRTDQRMYIDKINTKKITNKAT